VIGPGELHALHAVALEKLHAEAAGFVAQVRLEEREIEKSKGAKRGRLIRRVKLLTSLHKNSIRPEWMILTSIPVVPPDLRPRVAGSNPAGNASDK
jgi:DNA-directed RNA polymerase subunit beta'